MFFTIYKITNKINQKIYIGKHKTTDINDGYMGSGKLIKRAIDKYGLHNFYKEIIAIFDNEEEMNNAEKQLVSEEFCKQVNTYNLCPGGNGGFGYINLHSLNNTGNRDHLKRAKKLSNTLKIKMQDPAHLQYMQDLSKKALKICFENNPNGTFYNKKHSEETKLKMSNSAKIRTKELNSQYGTCWITDGTQNKKIQKKDIDIYLELGYYKGRVM